MVTGDPVIGWIVRLIIAALLLSAAIPQLRNRAEFAGTIENYRIVPTWSAGVLSFALPLAELVLGLAVLVFVEALAGAALLLIVYAAAVALNLARGRNHIDCGCHFLGRSGGAIDRSMVLRNILLAIIAFAVAFLPASARAIGAIDLLSIASAVVVAGLIYAAAEQARINNVRARLRETVGAFP